MEFAEAVGKVVSKIEVSTEDHPTFVDSRFSDGTGLSLDLTPRLGVTAEQMDWAGEGKVIKQYGVV